MTTFTADHRMKIRARPTIKIGSQFQSDHGIFSYDQPEETPHRMRKPVEVVEVPEDFSVLRVGKKHIEEPAPCTEDKKVFGSGAYDPAASDRFKSTRRYHSSGNIITGEVTKDAFESMRPQRAKVDAHAEAVNDPIKHAPAEAPAFAAKAEHENKVKRQRGYCPFAVDDGYSAPAQSIKPLHPSNINHGNVLTGGEMSAEYAGRRM